MDLLMLKKGSRGPWPCICASWYSAHSLSYGRRLADSTPICRASTAILSVQFCSGMISILRRVLLSSLCVPQYKVNSSTSFAYQAS